MVQFALLVVTYTNRKASAVPQMSLPDAATVNTPLVKFSLPALQQSRAPTSCATHGDGRLAVGVALAGAEFVLWPAPLSAFTT